MKKKYIIFISLIIIGIISVIITCLFSLKDKDNKLSNTKTYTIPSVEKVFVNGKVEPQKSKDIYLDLSKGEVYKVSVKSGQNVKIGNTLFTYKNDKVKEQIEQIELQLNSAKKQKEQLLTEQKELEKKQNEEKEKLESLGKGSQAKGNQNILVSNSKEAQDSKISTTNIDNQIELYEKQIENLEKNEYEEVTAQISGKVIIHNQNNNAQGPYMTVQSEDFYVDGTVSEKDQAKLKNNQKVDIIILATNKNMSGKISKISDIPIESNALMDSKGNATGNATGNNMSYYKVNISVDSQNGLTEGFHVQASVPLDEKPIEINKVAILNENGGSYVFKVVDGKLEKQSVTYSGKKDSSDKVIINSGLNPNDEIVENPNSNMKEGTTI
ncbi:MAG: HlyD family efflux transporter periplasmic adaptor subunit [Romboutsia sp.]